MKLTILTYYNILIAYFVLLLSSIYVKSLVPGFGAPGYHPKFYWEIINAVV